MTTDGKATGPELDAMLSVSPLAVGFLDRDLRYTRVTPPLAALHGTTVDGARGRPFVELFAAADACELERRLGAVFASGAAVSGVEATTARDRNDPRHLVGCFFPVAIGGDVIGAGVILVDDTERRRFADVARQRTLELEAVIASIAEGIYVGDTSGVRTANRAALAMLGYTELADLDRPVDELMRELDARAPDGRVLRAEENVFVRALGGETAREDLVIRHHVTGEDRVIDSSAAPIRIDDRIVGAVAVNSDVTDRRRVERGLRTQYELATLEREVLAQLGDRAPLDRVLDELALGLERITSSGLLASVLRIDGGLIRHVSAPSLPPAWCQAIDGESIGPAAGSCGTAAYRRERVIVTDVDVDPLWERYRDVVRPFGLRACWSQPILATDGNVLGTVALYYRDPRAPTVGELEAIEGTARVARIALERHRDEALRDQLVAELQDALRYSEVLVGILGHDLRNPLQAIITGAQLAQRRLEESQRMSVLSRVHASAERMGRMIGQILDLTRARQAGGIPISRQPIDLAAIARAVASEMELAYPRRRLAVEISGPTSGSWDGDRLSQVFSNLLGNAMQHGSADEAVELRVAGDERAVAVHVKNGGAIPDDNLPWLFDPFRRGSARASGGGGLGLGLFITKQIVLAHGGQISVRSRPEEGTRFELVLPRIGD